MTDISETTETTELELEETEAPPPFLRIVGTYPIGPDRFSSISVEVNLRGVDALAEEDGRGNDVPAWFTDFCKQVVDSMQEAIVPPLHVVTNGPGEDTATAVN